MIGNGYQRSSSSSLPRVRIDLRDIYRLDQAKGYRLDIADEGGFEKDRAKIFFMPSTNEAVNNDVHRTLVLSDAKILMRREDRGYEISITEELRQVGRVDCAVMILLGDHLIRPKNKTADLPMTSPAPGAIFRLGHLTALLGTRHVVVLHEDGPYFKCPTHYFEASYIPLDLDGCWRMTLSRHLRALGVSINENVSSDSFFNVKVSP